MTILSSLNRSGIAAVKPFKAVRAATAHLNPRRRRPGHCFYTKDGDPSVGAHDPRDVLLAPGFLRYVLDFLPVVKEYLGTDPTVYSVGAYWAYPYDTSPVSGVQTWHRDYDDSKFLALFVYGSAVLSLDDGPHFFQPGTQDGSEADPHAFPITVIGPEGSAWLENAHGLHMGLKPFNRARPRLLYQARFSWWPRPRAHEEFFGNPPALATVTEVSAVCPLSPYERECLQLLVKDG